MNLVSVLDQLKKNRYKITEQRKAILQVMTSHHQTLLSVESIFQQAKELFPRTNMSTVYRNLEILEELGLLFKTVNDDGLTLYKLLCTEEHHHHIICKKCGKTEVLDFCPMHVFKELSESKNYQLTDHKLELYGYCQNCKE